MRKAIRSSKIWVGGASLKDFVVVLERPGQHVASNRRYNQQLKRVAGVLEGAYALLMAHSGAGGEGQKQMVSSTSSSGWWGRRRRRRRRRDRRRRRNRRRRTRRRRSRRRRTRRRRSRRRRERRRRRNRRRRRRWGVWDVIVNVLLHIVEVVFSCVGVAAATVAAYMKKIQTPGSSFGCVFGVIFGRPAVGSSFLTDLLKGKRFCAGFGIKIVFGVVIGLVMGAPSVAMTRLGLSIEAGFSISSCTGALKLGISVGMAGSVIWLFTACIFGRWLVSGGAGKFNCAKGAGIGITVFCCNFNLLTGEESCR